MTVSSESRTAHHYLLLLSLIGAILINLSVVSEFCHASDVRWVIVALFGLAIIKIAALKFDNQGHDITVTVSDVFVYLSLLIGGTDAAIIVAAISSFAEGYKSVKTRLLLFFNISAICCSLFLASLVTRLIFGNLQPLANNQATFLQYVLGLGFLATLHWLVNIAIVIGFQKLRGTSVTWEVLKRNYIWALVTNLTGVTMAATVYALVLYFGIWTVVVSIPLLLACHALTRPYIKNIETERAHAEEIRDIHKRTLEAFATAVDAKDQITHDHVRRVQIYATGMARLLNLSEAEIEALRAGALLHDIGKIAVPDYILNKPGKLTAAEFDKMKIHTIAGAQILDQIRFPYPLVPVVRHHHERWDGKGYPDGLKGEAIPITARILTVVDCFDAFRQDRQYRKGMTRQEAIDLLIKDRNVFYDPAIVDLFIENLPVFEAEIAAIKDEEHVFVPVTVTETEAIRQATPAAGLMEERKPEKQAAYLKTILDSHQQGQEMYALFEMTQKMIGVLKIEDILNVIGSQLKQVVPHDTCAIFMVDPEGGIASPKYTGGTHADLLRKHGVRLGEGVSGWAIANNKIFINSDPKLDFSCLGLEDEMPPYKTMAALPIVKGEKVFGALAVYSQTIESYSTIYAESLERITTMLADSLYSATLYAEACQKLAAETSREAPVKSLTDSLTGLPNEHALPEIFAKMSSGTAAESSTLSLMKIGLKENDALTRDVVRETAAQIRQLLRSTDELIRSRESEFIALLPETTGDALGEIAARIQSTLPQAISIGQAQMTMDGTTLEQLLTVADARLLADQSAHESLKTFEAIAALATS